MEKKKSDINWIFVIIASGIMVLFATVGVIFAILSQKADERFELCLNVTRDYINANFTDTHYFKLEDKVLYVNVWQPGAAMYMVMKKGIAEQEIRERFEPLAKWLYSNLKKYEVEDYYKVCLILRNDTNTENVLMWWIDGIYQDPNKKDETIFY